MTLKRKLKNLINRIISKLYYKINKQQTPLKCSLCNNLLVQYEPLPSIYKEQAIEYNYRYFGTGEMTSLFSYTCPYCGATDRERYYAYWLKKFKVLEQTSSLLHFAPESNLLKFIKKKSNLKYVTADLFMNNVDCKEDLMQLTFKDSSFDSFICSHVLEHVPDDKQAISELYRILKPGGWGILMAPISTVIEETLEDPRILSPEDRWQHFGQEDHLRLYSHNDYVGRLKSVGFQVEQLGINYFSKEIFYVLGLKESSILYIVKKK